MTNAIGGYLELELRKGKHFHQDALRLNTGRNCFEYILRARGYKHVWLPYYTCEVLLEPLHKLNISYSFYNIDNNLEPETLPSLNRDEAFLYTNYYGLKSATLKPLSSHYGNQLIVDNAQAFFASPLPGIDTFYTARKFFGVPDGAYLYTDARLDIDLPQDESFDRMSHLLKRIEYGAEFGFADYQQHEEALCHQPIKKMSRLTESILENIDYKTVQLKRIANFNILNDALRDSNKFVLNLNDSVPMVYPYWSNKGTDIRRLLQQQHIYIATYWPNVVNDNSLENLLKMQLLPIPIDQRYGKEDITRIITTIKECITN